MAARASLQWRFSCSPAIATATSSEVAAAVAAGHYVIIPMGLDEDPGRDGISLPRIARDEGRDALLAAGWAREHADRDAAQAPARRIS
jgi:hypothetical protein